MAVSHRNRRNAEPVRHLLGVAGVPGRRRCSTPASGFVTGNPCRCECRPPATWSNASEANQKRVDDARSAVDVDALGTRIAPVAATGFIRRVRCSTGRRPLPRLPG